MFLHIIFGNNLNYQSFIQGRRGIGFKLTNDGIYDIENKRLVNVNEPEDDRDVVIYSLFLKSINELIKNIADLDDRLESLRIDNYDMGEYMEDVKIEYCCFRRFYERAKESK